MKLERRTVLAGSAAALALPVLASRSAHADARRQSLVDRACRPRKRSWTARTSPTPAG